MPARNRRANAHVIRNAYIAVCGEPKPLALAAIHDAWDLAEAAGYVDSSCEECGAEEGEEHEEGCRHDPDWEPSDDDLDLSGEGAAASREAERRALRDAGRDRGGW